MLCRICALWLPCGTAHAQGQPDWIRAAIAAPRGTYPADTNAVVLLDDTVLSVAEDGKAVERQRHVVRLLRPEGRDEGLVFVPFDAERKLLSLHVWSVGPDGHEYTVKDSEMVDRGYGGGNFYEDMKVRVATPPGRDPGGVVAFESEQRLPSYQHQETWEFQDNLPRVSQNFTLELPSSWTFGTTWAHHGEVKAIDLENGHFRWERNNEPGIDLRHVPLKPSLGALAGRMTVYFGRRADEGTEAMGTWKGLGLWYDLLSHDRLKPTPEIAAKAAELAAGKADFYAKAEAIGEFVQKDVRYFVIERGIGGLQPHFAGEIFHNRFGDCKDKATLLSAMLSTEGIHSVIVLVDSRRGVIDPRAPSLVGNHAIAAIELPKGYDSPKLRSVVTTKVGRRYLIFDPTWEKTPFGQLENNLQGSYGTLVDGADSEEIELPVLPPELNTIHRSATLQLAQDGSLTGTVVDRRFGDLSEEARTLYASSDGRQQRMWMEHELSGDFGSFVASNVKVENVSLLNQDITTHFDLTAERYARTAGPLLLVRPRVLGTESFRLDPKQRSVPIDLKQTMQSTDDFTIELPAGYVVDETPEPVAVDVGFAAYRSATEIHGRTLHYSRTFTVRQLTVPAERYEDLKRLSYAIGADEANNAVFKKQP